ncbi:Mis6-domain-containing protein [Radiomyces spectabilis]|uniref:Mis6-domain-containing protein n=1 Tax=Radiomyces spectabilis TaxID=64574 RepID=UPI0022202406|nr:Mis6-domain-containing protein [Radiomyces spectabilis]KAI8366097.1 Mis6-domain-containing protein [Radiomyces spectabilis]
MNLVLCHKLPDNYAILLLKLCLPRTKVPEKYAIRIFGYLSCREYSPKLMSQLLSWVISIFDLFESTENISNLYSVLFHYLNIETFRPQLCHLLYFLTKRAHVKAYRARQLIQLSEKVGREKWVDGLLYVYKTYDPELGIPELKSTRKGIFEHPNKTAQETLQKIHHLWHNDETIGNLDLHKPPLETLRVKRRKKDSTPVQVPDVATSLSDLSAFTIKEINNSTELAKKMDRMKLPDQVASVLDNHTLQHVLVCHPAATTVTRINLWLGENLMQLIKYNDHSEVSNKALKELLLKSIRMARFLKSHIPVLETFLKDYIKTWNGVEFEQEIFELLTFVKPETYEDMYQYFLQPLYRLFCVSNVSWKARLILCYTEWLKNWALLDWNEHAKKRRNLDPYSDMDESAWLFQGLSFNIDYFRTMQEFIQHVDRICVIGFSLEQDHPLIQHAALSYFELVSSISIHHDIPEIIIPAAPLVYRTFFSPLAMPVSRMCGIIFQYKQAFEENEQKEGDWVSRHTQEYLQHFNSYVTDMCNALWRTQFLSRSSEENRAFSLTEELIVGYQEIAEKNNISFDQILSLCRSAALAGFANRFLATLENDHGSTVRHNSPIDSQMLKELGENGGIAIPFKGFRLEYLDHLAELGFRGIHDLLYACIRSLTDSSA